MIAFRLADAPPLLAQLHREKLEREARRKAASAVVAMPPPPPPAAEVKEPVKILSKPDEVIARVVEECRKLGIEPLGEQGPRRVRMALVIEAVSAFYGYAVKDVLSDRREKSVSFCRHVAIYLCKELTPHSFPEIGRKFRRDHSSIWYAVDRISLLISTDDAISNDVETIKRTILGAL